jgi:hypothetical protein
VFPNIHQAIAAHCTPPPPCVNHDPFAAYPGELVRSANP